MNRFFKKSVALIALVGAMTAFSSRNAEAAYLVGQVDLTGAATKDGTKITFTSTQVQVASGDFAGFLTPLDPVVHQNPLFYNPFGGPYTPLWSHASGVTFDLSSLVIEFQNAATLVLSGTGIFHMAGYDDTPAVWNYTMNQINGQGSFSASSAVPVPEPASLALLGLGLAGVAAARRRKQA